MFYFFAYNFFSSSSRRFFFLFVKCLKINKTARLNKKSSEREKIFHGTFFCFLLHSSMSSRGNFAGRIIINASQLNVALNYLISTLTFSFLHFPRNLPPTPFTMQFKRNYVKRRTEKYSFHVALNQPSSWSILVVELSSRDDHAFPPATCVVKKICDARARASSVRINASRLKIIRWIWIYFFTITKITCSMIITT